MFICTLGIIGYRYYCNSTVLYIDVYAGSVDQWTVRDAARVSCISYIQVLSTLERSSYPWDNFEVVRIRARIPVILIINGNYHIRHCGILCGEGGEGNQIHEYPSCLLVYHCNHDNPRVSDRNQFSNVLISLGMLVLHLLTFNMVIQ